MPDLQAIATKNMKAEQTIQVNSFVYFPLRWTTTTLEAHSAKDYIAFLQPHSPTPTAIFAQNSNFC